MSHATPHILQALIAYAPNAEAQSRVSEMYGQAVFDGANDNELDKMLSGALSDGLRYGNWPWVKPGEGIEDDAPVCPCPADENDKVHLKSVP